MITPPPLPQKIHIEGAALVVPRFYNFPEICLFTGSAEDLVRMRRKLSWHTPAIYLGVFAGVLVYIVLALALRKTADVTFSITRRERARRRTWHLANWGVFLMTFVSLFAAGAGDIALGYYLAPIFLIASLVIYFLKVRMIYPKTINDQ